MHKVPTHMHHLGQESSYLQLAKQLTSLVFVETQCVILVSIIVAHNAYLEAVGHGVWN